MFGLSGLAARIVSAVLYGVVTFVVLFIIGLIVAHFDASIGSVIEKYCAIIAVLVGLYVFFTGAKPTV